VIVAGDVLRVEELRAEVQPGLAPLHVEVEAEGDGVVLVVDLQHVADLDAHVDHVELVAVGQIELAVIAAKENKEIVD